MRPLKESPVYCRMCRNRLGLEDRDGICYKCQTKIRRLSQETDEYDGWKLTPERIAKLRSDLERVKEEERAGKEARKEEKKKYVKPKGVTLPKGDRVEVREWMAEEGDAWLLVGYDFSAPARAALTCPKCARYLENRTYCKCGWGRG